MSLSKCLLLRLNSDTPLSERCLFAKELCKTETGGFSYKSTLIVNWLCDLLNTEKWNSTHEIFETLNSIIKSELQRKGPTTSLMFKSSFAQTIQRHVKLISESEVSTDTSLICLSDKIVGCVLLILQLKNTSNNLISNPKTLLEILALNLKYVAQMSPNINIPETLITGIEKMVTYILASDLQHRKILDVVISDCLKLFIIFIYRAGILKDNCNLQQIALKIRGFIKELLCHVSLYQGYKIALKLEPANNLNVSKTNPIEDMIKSIELWLQSNDSCLKNAAEEFAAILLEGFLERISTNSVDIPFSLIIVFTNMFQIDNKTSMTSEKIEKLIRLLCVCSKYPSLLQQNGKIPRAKKLQWFHKLLESILNCDIEPSPASFQCISFLVVINSDIVEQQIENLWRLSLRNQEKSRFENHSQFLCLLLKTFVRLRRVPKLFLKLTLALKNYSPHSKRASKSPMEILPEIFLAQFSECVVSLPIGQTLELWKLLLESAERFLDEASDPKVNVLVQLISGLLTHMKLTANEIPAVKVDEVKNLMHDTETFLQKSLRNSSKPNFDVLSLCYAWGEASLTMLVYENVKSSLNQTRESSNDELFDLTSLHNYATAKEWTVYMSKIAESSDIKLSQILLLLLIQRVRYIMTFEVSTEERKLVISKIASYVLNFVCETVQPESDKQSCSNDLWGTVMPWLSFLVPAISSKLLLKLCKIMSVSLLENDVSNGNLPMRLLFKSSFFLESRSIQTALMTCLWAEYGKNGNGLKRKLEDTDEEEHNEMFKSLSKHPRKWQKFAETKPEVSENEHNSMWHKIRETATTFRNSNGSLHPSVNVDIGLKLVHTLCLFPLEDMEPGNQMRCVLGLLHIFSSLKDTKHEKKTQIFVLLCQALIALLQKIPASRMTLMFEPSILLRDIFAIILNSSLNEEENKCSLDLFDKMVFTIINDESALPNIEPFTNQLIPDNGNTSLELKCLEIIVKRVMSLMKKYASFDRVDKFQSCDYFAKSLVGKLNKKLAAVANLDEQHVWDNFHCLLSYHCFKVPTKMKCIKRKPKRILKEHPSIVTSLMVFNSDDGAMSGNVGPFLQLVGLICENRSRISKYIPDEFISRIWPIFVEALISNPGVSDDMQDKIQLYALGCILKSCTSEELETIVEEINSKCTNLVLNNDVYNLLHLLDLWNKVIMIDFGNEPPKILNLGVSKFMKILLPIVFQLESDPKLKSSILQVLLFVASAVQKCKELSLKYSQIMSILQACASVKLSDFEPLESLELCNVLLEIYQKLLTKRNMVILQAVAPFLSCLTVILRQLITTGNQVLFNRYKDSTKSVLLTAAQDLSKLLGLVANHKTEFSKQAGFVIAEYLSQVQTVTVHTLVKEQLLLGIYKLMDICDNHTLSMLQVSLTTGGREILNQLRNEFNQNYRYKGKV